MIKVLLFDLSYTLLFPKDTDYRNQLKKISGKISKNKYDPHPHYFLDLKLLGFMKSLKSKFKLYIFTTLSIQSIHEFREKIDEVFERIFSASEMGVSKKDPNSYLRIAKLIEVDPKEILFIDDSSSNCEAAKIAGLASYQYQNSESLIEYLQTI